MQISKQNLDEVFNERYAIYGAATVKSRAIPSIEDGLNPVTRRIIHIFNEDGYSLKFKKAAFYVGTTLGIAHPHSDLSVYSTMIGLAQPFNKLNVLIDKQGNVGSIADPKSYAAQRYVELRMSSFTKDTLCKEMNSAYIPMMDNYDASRKEPIVLPSTFPMILNIGNQGIASGFASEIPPHKVDDICDITIKYINNPDIVVKELTKNFRPDFPMGGIILNEADLPVIYKNGQGVIYLQATIEESEYQKKPCLIVKDLPYKVSTGGVLEQIKEHLKPNKKTKAPGIFEDKLADVKDLSSSSNPVNLILIPKKDVSLSVLKNLLLEHTSLRTSIKYIANVLFGNELIENAPLNIILEKWVEFRISTLTRKYNYEIKTKSENLILKKALLKAQSQIDEVIKIIKGSKSEEDAIAKLRALLSLTNFEAKYIANIRLYQIARVEVAKLKESIQTLQTEISELISLISNKDSILKVIISELDSIKKKYKSERRTQLTNTSRDNFDVREVIESEDLVIAISNDNYVYAKPLAEMKDYCNRGAKGSNFIDSKYKKVIRDMFTVNSHDDLFVFTDNGKVIEIKGYQLNLWHKSIRMAISDLENQNVISVIKADFKKDLEKQFVFCSEQSLTKRVLVSEMISQRKMKGGNIAIKINEGDSLVGVSLIDSEDDHIVITSNTGRMQRIPANNIELMLRPTSGRPRAKIDEEAGEVIQSITTIPANKINDASIIVASSDGYGKLVKLDELPERRREGGGRGAMIKIITLKPNETLVCGKTVLPGDHIVATSSNNKTMKLDTEKLNSYGRTAKGSRIVTLSEGEKLLNIEVV